LGGIRVDNSTITINGSGVISATTGAAQVNSDWTQTNTSLKSFIQNKPTAGTNISFQGNTITNTIIGSPTQNIIDLNINHLIIKDKPNSVKEDFTDIPLTSGNEPTITSLAFSESIRTFTHSGGTEAQTTHSITIAQNTICDILIVGGGGGGGKRHGAGGGAGTLLYHKNIILNGTYNIKVGKGGAGATTSAPDSTGPYNGEFSQFVKSDGTQNYYATGGGRGTSGGSYYANTNGGQGYLYDANLTLSSGNIFNGVAVTVSNKEYVNTLTSPEGCRGRIGGTQINNFKGGGGGGAGCVGMNHAEETTINDGYGGLGLAIDITGTSVVYVGGGNGSDFSGSVSQVFDPSYPTIQSRGGGGFGSDTGTAQNGLNGTGGGGGGQGNDAIGNPGGNGGSGIVIIKFRTIVNTGIPEGNPITHKTLTFTHDNKLLKYDFTNYNTEASWKTYATIPNFTYFFDYWFNYLSYNNSIFAAGPAIGFIQMTLPKDVLKSEV
jgi:fibronectin-binding autotransporter adhesin